MNEQAFAALEYDSVRLLFKRYAQTQIGRAKCETLAPIDNRATLQKDLDELAECYTLQERGSGWAFSDFGDPQECFAVLRIQGSTLEPLALLELACLCEQAVAVRKSIQTEQELCPTLWARVEHLPRSLGDTASRITTTILPGGEIDDRASPILKRIRDDRKRLRANINRELEKLMRQAGEAIQDELVTVRSDRFVIPVKSDHRGRLQGVVHSSSSSGATVFLEPLETIESNNQLQELKEKEAREITRILFVLTEQLRNELSALELAAEAVAELDLVNAKGAFLREFKCAVPTISRDNTLELTKARHPLLEEHLRSISKEVVPVSFTLNKHSPVMVISGANAGGKTVVLKTAGLLSLMALSGLPVPAAAASVPLYASVLADIGDHQSIAANLSTFTSHMANISQMMQLCEQPALVLLDEAGTGTDPEEGSALGVAIVHQFCCTFGAHVIATTHYRGLKMYAARADGVQNASVEFNEKTLKPTYRLIVGLAGGSSGMEIASRSGIPEPVIRDARSRVEQSSFEATEFLQHIKRESDRAKTLGLALEEERQAVAEKYASLDGDAWQRERRRQKQFEKELLQALKDFDKRTSALLSQVEDQTTRARLQRVAKGRRERLKRKTQDGARQATVDQAKSLKDDAPITRAIRVPSKDEPAEPSPIRIITSRRIKPGDSVRLKTLGSIATVEEIDDENVELRVGSMRAREKMSNLELVEVLQPPGRTGAVERVWTTQAPTHVMLMSDDEEISAELKLIGKRTDDAVDELDRYLDRAFLKGFTQLRIVHGFGTGALRRAVQTHLKNHPHVSSFTAATTEQGGEGVTVVELKS